MICTDHVITGVIKAADLPERGGSSSAPKEISSSSAATRASKEGGVGKGKLITCKFTNHGVNCIVFYVLHQLCDYLFIDLVYVEVFHLKNQVFNRPASDLRL